MDGAVSKDSQSVRGDRKKLRRALKKAQGGSSTGPKVGDDGDRNSQVRNLDSGSERKRLTQASKGKRKKRGGFEGTKSRVRM